jgi:hypothetical protein
MRAMALLVLLAPTQEAKARYLQARADQMQYFWVTRLELADWARANGLNEEARSLLEFMVRNIPGFHSLKSKAETRLKGSWRRNPTRADAKRLADYQERLRDYYRGTADRAFAAYRAAEGNVFSYLESLSSRADVADNYWVVEGIAVTLAAMAGETPPRPPDRRAPIPKLANFCALGYDEFLKGGHANYAAASLLCRYLIDRDRAKFVRFLRDYYRGRGTTAGFARTMDASLEDLERGLREWVRGYAAAARGIDLPPAAELEEARRKGEAHRAVVGVVSDRAVWARALQAVDERTGLFDGTAQVAVRFGTLEGRQGEGGGGRIVLDLQQLSEYWKRTEEFRAAVREGRTWSVPPARLEAILVHELTHCFQGDAGPAWVREGLAAYAARDFHFVYAWRHAAQKAGDIEGEVKPRFVFARAWAFFEYLEAKHGADAPPRFAALVVKQGIAPPAAAREVTGLDWDGLKKDELRWSTEWLSNAR